MSYKPKKARGQVDTKKEHARLWKVFSEYVRRKEKGICFTCGKQNWDENLGEWTIKGTNAGHYKHNVLDFDEDNVHCQCIRCNMYLSGNGTEYSFRLLKSIGEDGLSALHKRAYEALAGEVHTKTWYLEQITKYHEKIRNLPIE